MVHGGKIPVGQFIPVRMHEYTVVALHQNLIEKDGFVCWIREEVVLVSNEMIPEHNNERCLLKNGFQMIISWQY